MTFLEWFPAYTARPVTSTICPHPDATSRAPRSDEDDVLAQVGGDARHLMGDGVRRQRAVVYLVGVQNRLLVLILWTTSFPTRGRGTRLITGTEPEADDTHSASRGRASSPGSAPRAPPWLKAEPGDESVDVQVPPPAAFSTNWLS